MTPDIDIFEVGPRDGLQNEAALIATDDKIKLVDLLSQAGFRQIEVTSFVSPKWVPQMADAASVMAGITRHPDIDYAVLTPNLRGFEGALSAKANEVAIFGAASEGFSEKNINCSIAESLERFSPVMDAAQHNNIPVRGYISCVVACPYDGITDPHIVLDIAEKLLEMGCYEISLGDTIGVGRPDDISRLLEVLTRSISPRLIAGHFHDTAGRALDNVDAALQFDVRRFDTAVGGLGGCPYAPGAKGNLATTALVQHLHNKGYATGLDHEKLIEAEAFLNSLDISAKTIREVSS